VVFVILSVWGLRFVSAVFYWKAYIWIIPYLTSGRHEPYTGPKHVVFVMADHFEPGRGESGVQKTRNWLARFQPIADRHFDSRGNRFRYNWFYPYDHKNEAVLPLLNDLVCQGYGEIELHWHLPSEANSENFATMLDEAIAWYQRYGALISGGEQARTAFAFIAGNWRLDGSEPNRHTVTNQLQTLFDKGCYADFTFSTIGTVCQPRKINSIYYVYDTPGPKSYDDGMDARVDSPVNDALMIFEGPLSINLLTGAFEYGAVESDPRPNPQRVAKWIDADIHVRGRPEWIFVKVYTHGCQSEQTLLGGDLDRMLTWLESECRRRGHSLHYMTAREAYNVAKAAEDGRQGDPEVYRDYRVPKPLNMMSRITSPIAEARRLRGEAPADTLADRARPKPEPAESRDSWLRFSTTGCVKSNRPSIRRSTLNATLGLPISIRLLLARVSTRQVAAIAQLPAATQAPCHHASTCDQRQHGALHQDYSRCTSVRR
jgi:hypothetical protein